MTDFTTWLLDNDDRPYRYWAYKRMFTPEEQDAKYSDQSCFASDTCDIGYIVEAVELPDGDVLLGFEPADLIGTEFAGSIHYYKLSEIRLEYCPTDEVEKDDC